MPDVLSYNDYYPFGYALPGRSASASNYRYGFQGQEKDDEIKGEGLSYNYKYRMHDPRIGRFFAVDPMSGIYPHNSPYAFSENRVIDGKELEGLEVLILSQGQEDSQPILLNGLSKDEVAAIFVQHNYEFHDHWYDANASPNEIWNVFKSNELGQIIRKYNNFGDWVDGNMIKGSKDHEGTFKQKLKYIDYKNFEDGGPFEGTRLEYNVDFRIPGTDGYFGIRMSFGRTVQSTDGIGKWETKYTLLFDSLGVKTGMDLGYNFMYDLNQEDITLDVGGSVSYKFIHGKISNQGVELKLGVQMPTFNAPYAASWFVQGYTGVKLNWGIGFHAGFNIDITDHVNLIDSGDWEGLFKLLQDQIKAGSNYLNQQYKENIEQK